MKEYFFKLNKIKPSLFTRAMAWKYLSDYFKNNWNNLNIDIIFLVDYFKSIINTEVICIINITNDNILKESCELYQQICDLIYYEKLKYIKCKMFDQNLYECDFCLIKTFNLIFHLKLRDNLRYCFKCFLNNITQHIANKELINIKIYYCYTQNSLLDMIKEMEEINNKSLAVVKTNHLTSISTNKRKHND